MRDVKCVVGERRNTGGSIKSGSCRNPPIVGMRHPHSQKKTRKFRTITVAPLLHCSHQIDAWLLNMRSRRSA